MSPFAHPIPAEWLTAYHDGELDARRRQQVEAHLPECPECRLELAGDRSVWEGGLSGGDRIYRALPDGRTQSINALRRQHDRLYNDRTVRNVCGRFGKRACRETRLRGR